MLGSTATGVVLSPEVLRRVACDAALVPHVLGSAGEDLDLGRVVRLFTRAQRRRLWRRDRVLHLPRVRRPRVLGSRPPRADTGPTVGASDVDNAALLCERHHAVVHHRRLWAAGAQDPDELGRYVHLGPDRRQLRPAPGGSYDENGLSTTRHH